MSSNGVVSVTNSLIGRSVDDHVGYVVTALTNNHYAVGSPSWKNETGEHVGAVTWRDGTMGSSGVVSVTNSLVGSSAWDLVGDRNPVAQANGYYVAISLFCDNEAASDAGAATLGAGDDGSTAGPITAENSVLGTSTSSVPYIFDYLNGQLVVGRPYGNIVMVFTANFPHQVFFPVMFNSESQ